MAQVNFVERNESIAFIRQSLSGDNLGDRTKQVRLSALIGPDDRRDVALQRDLDKGSAITDLTRNSERRPGADLHLMASVGITQVIDVE